MRIFGSVHEAPTKPSRAVLEAEANENMWPLMRSL